MRKDPSQIRSCCVTFFLDPQVHSLKVQDQQTGERRRKTDISNLPYEVQADEQRRHQYSTIKTNRQAKAEGTEVSTSKRARKRHRQHERTSAPLDPISGRNPGEFRGEDGRERESQQGQIFEARHFSAPPATQKIRRRIGIPFLRWEINVRSYWEELLKVEQKQPPLGGSKLPTSFLKSPPIHCSMNSWQTVRPIAHHLIQVRRPKGHRPS